MFKWQLRLLICILLGAKAAGAVEVWTAGGSGFAWDDVGELTGLTTDDSVLLPAVVDSTTNAVELLALKRRGGNISSPQSREDLTGLLTDDNAETSGASPASDAPMAPPWSSI